MIRISSIGSLKLYFEKKIDTNDLESTFNKDTYFVDALSIEDIEVNVKTINGEINKLNVIDWEIEKPDVEVID